MGYQRWRGIQKQRLFSAFLHRSRKNGCHIIFCVERVSSEPALVRLDQQPVTFSHQFEEIYQQSTARMIYFDDAVHLLNGI